MKKILYMYRFTGKYWLYAILCPIFMVGEAIFEILIPNIIADLIDELEIISASATALDAKEIFSLIGIYALKLIGFSLLSLICGMIGATTASIASSGFAANLKGAIFNKVEEFSFTNIDKYSTSSLITRMTTDSNFVQMSFQMSIRMLFRAPALFIFAIIMAAKFADGYFSIIYLIAIPIIVVGLIMIFAFSHPYFEKGIRKIDDLNEVVEENVKGIRVVKSFTLEEDEIKKINGVNDQIYRFFTKAMKIVNLNSPLMMFAIYVVMILIAYISTGFIKNSLMTIGDLQALLSYSIQILSSLMLMSMAVSFFIISKPSRDRIYEVFMEEPTIKNKENAVTEVKDGSVKFNDVSFRYNSTSEKNALNHINLDIKSGMTVGVLGTTGSSKTTLISMIARLYDATEGSIEVGGVNVKDYDLKTLRDAVSVVLQKNLLFSGTIYENLRWGNADATDAEVIEASKIAQSDSFVSQMPDGYNTYIEQGGSNVSGGQKQRLCIARAILKNPKVLILDDSMSAVDTKTDKLIREGLKSYRPDITKIIVAQRCASVMDADKIIIIDNGEIIAEGTHDELLKTSDAYKEVYYSQNKLNKEEL